QVLSASAGVPVTSVAISGSGVSNGKLSLAKGKSVQLSAAVSPSNATSKTVTWSSSDASVASVTGTGYVSAVKAGTAKITAAAGGKSATVTVTVTAPSTSGLNLVGLDGDSTTLSWQYSRQITAREADGSDFASVSWTLSDTTAFQFTTWGGGDLGSATFDKTVTGRTIVIEPKYDKGTATLTVKATRADGTVLTAQKTLVNDGGDSPDPATSLSLSGSGLSGSGETYTLTMNAGTSTQLTTSVAPAKANQHVIWYTLAGDDTSVATIDADGTVYAHKAGTMRYRAYTPSRSVLVTITVK
ncbi:Ig-like domain-containing protein, partial [Bifidobacterium thermophilum]|uniref:Ig-like domain-containing protein n=1 Tax=Bifidobacterium thermophilum TaxID=33905 RepID=UPI0030A213CB